MRARSDTSILCGEYDASTSSIHLESVSESSDATAADDLEPLLPQYSRQSTEPSAKKCCRFAPWSLVLQALLALSASVTVFFFWFILSPRTRRVAAASKSSLDLTRQFLSDPLTSNRGLIPFPSDYFSPLYTPASLVSTVATSSFPSARCVDDFVAKGGLCDEIIGSWDRRASPKVDLIYTWHNGSDPLMSSWKDDANDQVGLGRGHGARVLKHFREHDELRFSIRSAVASLSPESISTVHLVVGDTPSHIPGLTESDLLLLASVEEARNTSVQSVFGRSAQTPHWLNLSTIEFATSSLETSSSPTLRIHPHSELFKTKAQSRDDAREWQDSVVPSFNSLAIESQLPNLELDSETAIYLNDDFFLNEPLSVSDFESPLTGPVFRMQRDLLVGGVDPRVEKSDPEGEWTSLGTAAYMLDGRFGRRKRPYLVHVAKTVSGPMLKEVQRVFSDQLTQTAEARFRGKGIVETQLMHLLVHYTVEKHREALLYSYLVLRSTSSDSGLYTLSDRSKILREISGDDASDGSDAAEIQQVFAPRRSATSSMSTLFERTGLSPPKQTDFRFTSADGYAYFDLENSLSDSRGWPSFNVQDSSSLNPRSASVERIQSRSEGTLRRAPEERDGEEEEAEEPEESAVCDIELRSCFGTVFFDFDNPSSISSLDTFRRIAFEQPSCGDCLIIKLLGNSGETGLSAFLPEETEAARDPAGPGVPVAAIGLEGTRWQEIKIEIPTRANAISLIQRYSYAIGESSAAFRSIRYGGEGLEVMLEALSYTDETHKPPAFIALNDDIDTARLSVLRDVDKRLGAWFRTVWNSATPWELV
ncbi:hypothetical protein JCM3766R1_003003 [Sporobolomyces carnicolor]